MVGEEEVEEEEGGAVKAKEGLTDDEEAVCTKTEIDQSLMRLLISLQDPAYILATLEGVLGT